MSHTIKTGQLDLGGLQEYFTTNLSGSETNITGWYPYAGNPSDFATTGYITGISGDISGYIDSVSGVLATKIAETGLAVSGFASAIHTELKSDVNFVSGKIEELSGSYIITQALSENSENDIDSLSGDLESTGQLLSAWITGESGVGISGFVTGFVDTTSGALATKISNLDVDLRNHAEEDYLSKRDESEFVSGSVSFAKTSRFKQSVELERVADHDEVATYQSGDNIYTTVTGVLEGPSNAAHQVLTTFLRYPHSGDNVRQNLVVGSFMYSGGAIPS
jgi:hypothetical protein